MPPNSLTIALVAAYGYRHSKENIVILRAMSGVWSEILDPANLALEKDNCGIAKNGNNTLDPPFLRLPAEIRVMIYEFTLAKETVHVYPKSADPVGHSYILQLHRPRKYQNVASLLMTCRKIRKETRSTFYSLVIFDLTPYYNCMAAAYELGPEMCQTINAIRVDPRLAKRLAMGLQQGATVLDTDYQHMLPSLQHVYIQDSPLFGVLLLSHDLAIRALRLYFGHENLQVHFVE